MSRQRIAVLRASALITYLLILMPSIWVLPTFAAEQDANAKIAKSLMDKAVAVIEKEGPINAFYQFNTEPDKFVNGEIYVWVITMDGVILAHSSDPTMVGLGIMEAKDLDPDPETKSSARELVEYTASREEGNVEYVWLNPVSHKFTPKHSFFKRVSPAKFRVDFIVLAGYYFDEP